MIINLNPHNKADHTPQLSSSFPILPLSKTITLETSQEINVLFLNEGVITPLLLETNRRGEFLSCSGHRPPQEGSPTPWQMWSSFQNKAEWLEKVCVCGRRCSVARGNERYERQRKKKNSAAIATEKKQKSIQRLDRATIILRSFCFFSTFSSCGNFALTISFFVLLSGSRWTEVFFKKLLHALQKVQRQVKVRWDNKAETRRTGAVKDNKLG